MSKNHPRRRAATPFFALAVLLALAACTGQGPSEADRGPSQRGERGDRLLEQSGSIFGTGGILGARRAAPEPAGQGNLGVNSFLWRASLDVVNFIPLASADPFGGLIVTEWHRPEAAPNERLKLQVSIKDTRLRADALEVALFRQVADGQGDWLDAAVDPATVLEFEDRILTRARELRIAQSEGGRG